ILDDLVTGVQTCALPIFGAIAISFVAPDSFTFVLAVALFVGLVVGGVASIPGTLVGGLFVLFVPNIAESVSKGLAGAVYGVILRSEERRVGRECGWGAEA